MKERAQQLLTLIKQDIHNKNLILPSLPEVALRVRRLTESETSSINQLEREISKDPAITARIMKVANSSMARRTQPVATLHQALQNLGMNLVRSLVTQLTILQTMQSGPNDKRLRDFIDANLHLSALCFCLAKRFPNLDAEQAAVGGLLHDIGKLPLREFLRKQPDLTAREIIQFEVMLHPIVGAILLKDWNMPEHMIRMARYHEQVLRDSTQPAPDYVDIIIGANLIHYGVSHGRYKRFGGVQIPALRKCQLDQNNLSAEALFAERKEFSLSLIH